MQPAPTADPVSRPPLDRDRVNAAPGWAVDVVEASPSTHLALVERLRTDQASPGDVLVAEHQTAGRGRLDRTWTTPARAALTLSAAVDPRMPDEDWPWLPLLLGTATVAGISAAGGPACVLKWPNDVMHVGPDGRQAKLGGLLAERVAAPAGPCAVLSLGLNVSTTPAELPVPTATSLTVAGWRQPDRSALLLAVLAALRDRLAGWATGADGLRQEYAGLCVTVGHEVRVERPGVSGLAGRAVAVDRDGALVVASPAGRVRVNAGDVVHVRPQGAGGT